jgi:hypothetical protein
MKNLRPLTSKTSAALTALGAGVAATATHTDAAVIHFTTPVSVATGETWFLDGVSTTPLANVATGSISAQPAMYFPQTASNNFRFADSGYANVRELNPGSVVNAGAFLGTGANGSNIGWFQGATNDPAGARWLNFNIAQSGYAGFRFDTGAGVQYGWMNVTLRPGILGVTINEWAYESDVNTPIVIPVPEPSGATLGGLALLALGIAGRRAYRKREGTAEA